MKASLLQLVNDCFDDLVFIALYTYHYLSILAKKTIFTRCPTLAGCLTCAKCRLPYAMANIHKRVLRVALINMWGLDQHGALINMEALTNFAMRGGPTMANANRMREERLQIMLSAEELVLVDDFRFKTRMPSRASAVRELLKRGLAAEGFSLAAVGAKSSEYGLAGKTPTGR